MDEDVSYLDQYFHYLEDEDVCEDDKRQLLKTIHEIVTACVQMGFSIHPVQLPCGQRQEHPASATKTAQNRVDYSHPFNTKLMSAASTPMQKVSAESEQ